jgi:spore coat polysaccharide biosynthesis predicted glycosyltransferase SpsG
MINKIAIYCDCSSSSGLGHLTRMKNISEEFVKKGIECFFIFNELNKKFIFKHVKKFQIFFFQKDKKIESIKKILAENNFSLIIIDSYEDNLNLEKTLVNKGFYVVSIDDHLKEHFSNLVFVNRFDESSFYKKKPNQIWLMGKEYILIGNTIKKNKTSNYNLKKINLLFHAGASSAFRRIKAFSESTFMAIKKHNICATILCTSNISKKYIKLLVNKYGVSKSVKILPFTTDLSKKIKNYDIVAGPSGTTTFETIMSGVLPYSVPIKNDGRDSVNAWNSLGHFAHLSHIEKKNKIILNNMWELLIKNYHKFLNILKKNSTQFDGLGPRRLVKKIIFFHNQPNAKLVDTNIKKNKNYLISKECNVSDIRYFLNARNHKLARSMSTSSRIISLPEHINWWLRDDVRKFKIIRGDETLAYHWIKINKDKEGKFLTSAWFLSKDIPNNLKIVNSVLKIQCNFVKKNYKNLIWIITMKKKNKFVQRLNNKFGFYEACKNSINRVSVPILKKNNKIEVMEIKI